jgi:hypothetical protein
MPRASTPVVAYPERLQRCPTCQIYFVPDPKAKRPTIYCSHSCRQRAVVARRDGQEELSLTHSEE